MALTISETSPDFVLGSDKNIVAILWRGETAVAHIRELSAAIADAHVGAGPSVRLFQVMPPDAPPPDGETRREIARVLKSQNGVVSHSAIVQLGSGFRASVVRSIVTGIVRMSNPGYPHRVFSSVADACAWIHEETGCQQDLHLTAQLEDFFARAESHSN